MAVTPVGNPYVESSDLVANYPGVSEALAERIDIVGVNPFANAAARDAAIPSPVQGQMCSLNDDNKGYRYDGSAWILFSGAGPANFTNTATGTYTTGGIQYKFLTFTGSGELIVNQAGFADVLIVGGAGAGAFGGGGAGGHLFITNAYLPAGTLAVTVGAGGAAAVNPKSGFPGVASRLDSYFSPGGGGAAAVSDGAGTNGASGGGGGQYSAAGGAGISGIGNNGGAAAASQNSAGGGGGSGAVGSNGAGTNGASGGIGTANSITNVSVTRAAGGGAGGSSVGGAGGSGIGGAGVESGTSNAGTVNTGSGGGGNYTTGRGGAGGSGVVIIRVVV